MTLLVCLIYMKVYNKNLKNVGKCFKKNKDYLDYMLEQYAKYKIIWLNLLMNKKRNSAPIIIVHSIL